MKRLLALGLSCIAGMGLLHGQDTFSIVAVDTVTGEVGSAGASCVDLFNFPGYTTHFLGDLLPGVGAINTQAYYLGGNQTNARTRMQAGDSPQQVVDWLVANDVQGNPNIRQYGVVALGFPGAHAAAHTGMNTDDHKGHRVGPTYSIQGNILLGPEVLDSMEARFNAEQGDLACKLMAALQGANMVGADTRCASNGTSSLFAFVKVAQPGDPDGSPSFLIGLKTRNGDGIEPIDSLQVLFDAAHSCNAVAVAPTQPEVALMLAPNPVQSEVRCTLQGVQGEGVAWELYDANGRMLWREAAGPVFAHDVASLGAGLYWVRAVHVGGSYMRPLVKQ